MWFGTPDGLARYDGTELRGFKYSAKNATDVVNNFVSGKLLEDKIGNIWYSNESGIYKWDVFKEAIVKVHAFNKAEFGNVSFKTVYLDDAGSIWLFNPVYGMFEFSMVGGTLKQYPMPSYAQHRSFLYTYINVDEAGNFWFRIVAGNDPFLYFNRRTHGYKIQFADSPPQALFFANGVRIEDHQNRLVFTDTLTNRSNTVFKSINNKQISFFSFDGVSDVNGKLWMTARGNGLFYYDQKKEVFQQFHHDNSKINSLPFDLTTCLYIDRSQNLWIGIDGGGVARLDLKPPKFNLFPLSEGDYPVLNDYFTKCFFEDEQQRIWFGSHTNGLNILDTRTGSLTNFHHEKTNPQSLPGNMVASILKDKDGNIWIGSSGGISLFDEKRKAFKTIPLYGLPILYPEINIFVYRMIKLQNGDLLAATLSGLVKVAKNENNQYAGSSFCDDEQATGTTTDVVETADGTIYATHPGGAMYQLKKQAGKYVLIKSFLPGLDLRSVRIDETNPSFLWVATGIGLIHFNTITNKYRLWNEASGLANSYIYGSLEDEKHNLWISTNGGLSYIDRASGRIDNYTYQHGLQSNEFNTQAFYKSATNTFYFGGIKGFNWFQSKVFSIDQHKPQAAITQIEVDNIISTDSSILVRKTLRLPYYKNDLNFKFAALDYTRTEANKIQYKLDGWDTKWITTFSRSARYANLPPGDYTMLIKASNSSGIWSDEERLTLLIQKPYWQQAWFTFVIILVLVLLIVFITYSVVQLRVKQKLRRFEKQADIDAERNRISKDMHDEIGNGLTHIALLSELIQVQHKPGSDIKKEISAISTSARKLVQTMSEIIWALSPQNDTLDNLLAYVREQSQQYFEGMQIDFNIDFPDVLPNITLTNEQRRNLFLVTKEALANAMKHAQATSIRLNLVITSEKYCFNVMDDGIGMGFNKQKVSSNGIKNMRKRMEDIGGTIQWINLPKGTLVEYCLELD